MTWKFVADSFVDEMIVKFAQTRNYNNIIDVNLAQKMTYQF